MTSPSGSHGLFIFLQLHFLLKKLHNRKIVIIFCSKLGNSPLWYKLIFLQFNNFIFNYEASTSQQQEVRRCRSPRGVR